MALLPLVTLSRNEISPSLCQLLNEVSEAHSSAQLDQHKGFLIREKVHVIGVVSLEPTTPHRYQRGCLMRCFTLFSKHSTEDSSTVPKLNEVSLFISRKITFMKKILESQIKLMIIFSPPHSVKRDRKYSRIYYLNCKLISQAESCKLGKKYVMNMADFPRMRKTGRESNFVSCGSQM